MVVINLQMNGKSQQMFPCIPSTVFFSYYGYPKNRRIATLTYCLWQILLLLCFLPEECWEQRHCYNFTISMKKGNKWGRKVTVTLEGLLIQHLAAIFCRLANKKSAELPPHLQIISGNLTKPQCKVDMDLVLFRNSSKNKK